MQFSVEIKQSGKIFQLIKYHVLFNSLCEKNVCPHMNSYKVGKVLSDFTLGLYNNISMKDELLKGLRKNIDTNLKNMYCECYNLFFNNYDDFQIVSFQITPTEKGNDVSIKYEVVYRVNNTENKFSDEQMIRGSLFKELGNDDRQKMKCLLIIVYNILGFKTGQFWGLDPKFYEIINTNYKNPMECFASPFNNNLKNYYSPIPSLDKHFGSKGNFFKKFKKAKNDCFVMNPPFVEVIINKVLRMSLVKLKKYPEITTIYYLPNWHDIIDPFLETVRNKKYYCTHTVLGKGKSYVYDYINKKRIPNSSFELVLIVVSNSSDLCSHNKMFFNQLITTLT
jgi:hypothetical protein